MNPNAEQRSERLRGRIIEKESVISSAEEVPGPSGIQAQSTMSDQEFTVYNVRQEVG